MILLPEGHQIEYEPNYVHSAICTVEFSAFNLKSKAKLATVKALEVVSSASPNI